MLHPLLDARRRGRDVDARRAKRHGDDRLPGFDIPAPAASEAKHFALTQSGDTQRVRAVISRAQLGKKKVGMVTFAVPSGHALVDAIEDVQDYRLADGDRVIAAGEWHDGLKARDAIAACLGRR